MNLLDAVDLERKRKQAEMKATPYANETLGSVNDLISGLLGYLKNPNFTQQTQGLAGLLESTGIPKTVERLAYGEPLLTGSGYTTQLKPETRDALLTVAPIPSVSKPVAQAAERGAMALGRAGERYAERVVPELYAKGGMTREMLEAMGSGVRSHVAPVGMTKTVVSASPQVPRESFVPGVQAGQEMIVHHNITPEKLARVEKVGGMPVPSIAVSNVENPMMNFGDISLIGPKEMAIPSAKNPVYGFDAYTARAPRIDYEFDAASKKNLQKLFADVYPQSSYEVERLVQNWSDRDYSDIMKMKFLKEKGLLPDKNDYDATWKYSQALNDIVYNRQSEYADWMSEFEKKLPDAGVHIKERIFKGYTDSGNRRYAPATLENLVKEMKGGAGSEGVMYGVGNIRAVATPKFKNLNQVKAARTNIVSSEQFEPIKKQINEAYSNLSDRLSKLEGASGYRYEPSDALYEIGQSRNVNLMDKIYKDVPESLKADVQIFLNKVREMPTEYFEIKPQRAVQVGEFKGAILPANTPKQSIDYLRSQGLQDLYYYATPEERKELFKKFGPQMFGVMPFGLLADEDIRMNLSDGLLD